VRVLGQIRYEYEPDVDGDDEYQILDEIEKSQKDTDDDMSSDYIGSRFKELGVKEDTKIRIIPSISGDGSGLDGDSIFSHYHYSIKRIEFVKEENTVYLHF